MLKDNIYLILDIETTWTKDDDEIFQISFLVFDKKFNLIDVHDYYIETNKKPDNIVWFITSYNKINKNFVNFDIVKKSLETYLTDNTIIIWHNIEFDIKFLKKYMNIKYKTLVDTLILSKILYPYFSSYSLENLYYELTKKKPCNVHNSLWDVYMNFEIFKILIVKLNNLLTKYKFLWYYLKNSSCFLSEIINIDYNYKASKLLPLKKNVIRLKLISKENIGIEDFVKNEFSWVNDFIKLISKVNDNILILFPSIIKLKFFAKILKNYWIIDFEILTWKNLFNFDKINKLLNKNNFLEEEVLFLIKYYSLVHNWVSEYYQNLTFEKKILDFLSQKTLKFSSKILLATTEFLNFDYTNYNLIILDQNDIFQKYITSKNLINLNDFIEFFEKKIYSLSYTNFNIENFYNSFLIFLWVLMMELRNKMLYFWNTFYLDLDDYYFYKTKKILNNLKLKAKNFWKEYLDFIDEIFSIFNHEIKIDNLESFRFLKNNYIDFHEFIDFLKTKFKNVFLLKYKNIYYDYILLEEIKNINKYKGKIYVLTDKPKDVFDYIYNKYDYDTLLVEWITGSKQKIIWLLNFKDPLIVVWGDDLLIWIKDKFNYDYLIVYQKKNFFNSLWRLN